MLLPWFTRSVALTTIVHKDRTAVRAVACIFQTVLFLVLPMFHVPPLAQAGTKTLPEIDYMLIIV